MAHKAMQTRWAPLPPWTGFEKVVSRWVKTLSEGKHLLHRSRPSAFQKTQLVLQMTLLPRLCTKAAAERIQWYVVAE